MARTRTYPRAGRRSATGAVDCGPGPCTRVTSGNTWTMRLWMDPLRSLLAAAAAALAVAGAAGGAVDSGVGSAAVATRFLPLEAVACAAFVVVPSRGLWSGRRRALAALVAVVWTLVGLLLLIGVGARAACGCGDPSTGYVLPSLLWASAADWVMIAAVANPFLMAAAASPLPDRLER